MHNKYWLYQQAYCFRYTILSGFVLRLRLDISGSKLDTYKKWNAEVLSSEPAGVVHYPADSAWLH